jgi:DNA-binding IclR family transcriptional regulator
MAAPDHERRLIGSVHKALRILNLFDRRHAELGTTEIASALGLPKTTVAGLVMTLEANGYLDQNRHTRKYRLGSKLVERAFLFLSQFDLRRVARPYLEELLHWSNESVNLAIRDGGEVIYIERLYGSRPLGVRSEIGKRAPVHSTALGKAILAWLPEDDVRRFLAANPLVAMTPKTITDAAQLMEQLRLTRERGFAIDDEEDQLGGRCVAAPVFSPEGEPVASVSISAPVLRMPLESIAAFGQRVREATDAISSGLGYRPDNA